LESTLKLKGKSIFSYKAKLQVINIKIVVDCKCFSKRIDVKQVEAFCSMLEDLDAHQGCFNYSIGYSKAAINRAFYGNQKVNLILLL